MRVIIALASSSGQLSGVQRHALNAARCLLTREEVCAVHLVAAPWQQDLVHDAMPVTDTRLRIHAAPIGNSALSRNRWFYSHLPRMAAQLKADIVHLAYPAPVRRSAFSCPTVVTLHDLYPYDIPENFGFPKVLFNRAVLRQCMRAVDAIACVSQSTLSGLEHLEPQLTQKKAVLIHNSVDSHTQRTFRSPLSERRRWPFLLCVAQHRRNKNILLALQVFARLIKTGRLVSSTHMLIIGIPGPETKAIERFLAESGLANRVVMMNGISDAHLQWCYRNCALLLAPSSHEGFGLPVAEALLAGCRVVCSDIAAFRELGGSHCKYVTLGERAEEAFADAAGLFLHTRPPAPIAMPMLSAPVIAEKYMQLYNGLLELVATRQSSLRTPLKSITEGRHFP